ncbi:MAG TPA: ribosome small subunit-dependent GTPase A [Lachnospiraceae bacterium]|nr:ribosome small subunit-dependent GTPase A [Lachnospiraceae bacterium]HBR04140.1 ribosome small subunit-dependent GTPase A [Lachnospiraceae bacterium]HBZ90681.1 ribosome small subunit-dependent GTPase A [Lachnospiraceae bacterium]
MKDTLKGKIIKGVGGFYYVNVEADESKEDIIYECRAKGIFRKNKEKPLPGDDVELKPLSEMLPDGYPEGSIIKILERKNSIIRPQVANIDQAMVVFACVYPEPNLNLLDRFLINMERQSIPTVIVFNKNDLVGADKLKELTDTYKNSGYKVLTINTIGDLTNSLESGIEETREILLKELRGKTTVLAGPSGVGKSSVMKLLSPQSEVETGTLSEKIGRGKNTTRHTELFYLEKETYLLDTPGFSTIYIQGMQPEELRDYYNEFLEYSSECKFNTCRHVSEPGCAVKRAVEEGKINRTRYENYLQLFSELKSGKY